jgi:hypothetical protein
MSADMDKIKVLSGQGNFEQPGNAVFLQLVQQMHKDYTTRSARKAINNELREQFQFVKKVFMALNMY